VTYPETLPCQAAWQVANTMDQNLNKKLRAGLGLRRHFIFDILKNPPKEIDFFEIHPENYMKRGGHPREAFEKIAEKYPIHTHGLSLSIGSLDKLNWEYLKDLKKFLHQYKIPWHSDHLCFTSKNAHAFHDLLPLPLTWEAVKHVSERARIVQDFLEIPFALENVSFYLHPDRPQMTEKQFLQEILYRSGVSLMLDVNNIYVNAFNHGFDPKEYIREIAGENIVQIHIAGHLLDFSENLIIDTHGENIKEDVWDLLKYLGTLVPLPPVLVERDGNFPDFSQLLKEVKMTKEISKASVTKSQLKSAKPLNHVSIKSTPTNSSLEKAQTFIYHQCFDKDYSLDEKRIKNLVGTDTATFLTQQGDARLKIYRRLVFNNIDSVLRAALPNFFYFLNKGDDEKLVREFLEIHKPRSNYYWDVPKDFLNFLQESIKNLSSYLPYPFLPELANYEHTDYKLRFEKNYSLPQSNPQVTLDQAKLILNPTLDLKIYSYPVHQITQDLDPKKIQEKKTYLLLYRDPENYQIQTLTLNKASYKLIQIFLKNNIVSLAEGLDRYLKEHHHAKKATLGEEAMVFLKHAVKKRVILAFV